MWRNEHVETGQNFTTANICLGIFEELSDCHTSKVEMPSQWPDAAASKQRSEKRKSGNFNS